MSDKQTPDRKRASPSAPRRVEKVGEAQLTLPAMESEAKAGSPR